MYSSELPLQPACDHWNEFEKPVIIANKIYEICENILKKGEHTFYQEVLNLLYEHIDQNIEKFLPESDYE